MVFVFVLGCLFLEVRICPLKSLPLARGKNTLLPIFLREKVADISLLENGGENWPCSNILIGKESSVHMKLDSARAKITELRSGS